MHSLCISVIEHNLIEFLFFFYVLQLGGKLVLRCRVTGNPSSNVTWIGPHAQLVLRWMSYFAQLNVTLSVCVYDWLVWTARTACTQVNVALLIIWYECYYACLYLCVWVNVCVYVCVCLRQHLCLFVRLCMNVVFQTNLRSKFMLRIQSQTFRGDQNSKDRAHGSIIQLPSH